MIDRSIIGNMNTEDFRKLIQEETEKVIRDVFTEAFPSFRAIADEAAEENYIKHWKTPMSQLKESD